MNSYSPVVIVGSGPYGLSLAAHLRAKGIDFRIFGKPMDFWKRQMPRGMYLKSDGFASDLYAPNDGFTLKHFCAKQGIAYADIGIPVGLETFVSYGLAFKDAMVTELDERHVASIARDPRGFSVTLEDGEVVTAGRVVVAVGISYFPYVPPALASLPSELLTHSSEHHDLTCFRSRDVVVVGGGSSATDITALLYDLGANVQMIARRDKLNFNEEPDSIREFSRSTWQQIRKPMSGIGPGWRYKLYGDAPWLFRQLPRALRHRVVRRSHGPAGAWCIRKKVENGPRLLLGSILERAERQGDRIRLELRAADGARLKVEPQHIIAATGYKLDVQRLPFLSQEIRARLKTAAGTPVLSREFQASIPGLYFLGTLSANSFGPVMRFAFGAGYAARRLTQALGQQRTLAHQPVH